MESINVYGAESSTHTKIALFLEERGMDKDGLVGRSARDLLANYQKVGIEEDILLGIALVRAIAQWRAIAHMSGFDPELHQMQMHHEVSRVAKFLSRQFHTRSFLVKRPRKSIKKYVEILSQHSTLI